MKTEDTFRDPDLLERALIQRLLTAEFPGCNEVSQQLKRYWVRIIDQEGSLEIMPDPHAPSAKVEKTIPVEADGVDEDGIHVHFLLFVKRGFVNELEIYKDDGSQIKRLPSPNELEVIVLEP